MGSNGATTLHPDTPLVAAMQAARSLLGNAIRSDRDALNAARSLRREYWPSDELAAVAAALPQSGDLDFSAMLQAGISGVLLGDLSGEPAACDIDGTVKRIRDGARVRDLDAIKPAFARCNNPREARRLLYESGVLDDDEEDKHSGVNVATLADVQPESISWLWHGRIARGKLNLLDGDPGVGKSMITHAIAAAVSRGLSIDSFGKTGTPARVVLLSAEDGLADTIRPRLEAAGADLSRVVAITCLRCDDGTERPIVLPNDIVMIEARLDGAALIVVDPLMAFLSGDVNSHRDQDIRRVLHTLKLLAERTGAAILIVRHLNKTSTGNAKYRGGGSIGIIGAARCAMLAAQDPEDSTRFVLAVSKCNVAAPQASLAYQIVPDDRTGSARVAWLGESVRTADDLVAPKDDRKRDGALERATTFLREQLENGSRYAAELFEAAEAQGHSIPTIRRAYRKLGGKPDKEQGPYGRWFWTLPGQDDQPLSLNHLDHLSEVDHLTTYQGDQDDQGDQGNQLSGVITLDDGLPW